MGSSGSGRNSAGIAIVTVGILGMVAVILGASVPASAMMVVPSANLTVVVQTDGSDGTFHFDTKDGPSGQPVLWDDDSFDIQTQSGTGSYLESISFPETTAYLVTETAPSGWSVSNVECVSDMLGGTFDQMPQGIVISNAPEGSNITCTFHNTQKPQACVHGIDPTCNDNVLFIPGLEGSRLYMQDGAEKQLWEPHPSLLQSDVQKLFLNADGTSVNAIYEKAGSVIDVTGANILGQEVGRTDIYGSFLDELSQLASSTIADYLVFPYDWRMSPQDIVDKGTQYDDGTRYIDQELISLASTSKSGKVTIVAHSNGGLVAKALMEKLQAEGKADLVDEIIFVDVPQLGTPTAIASMLHGDFQGIGWNGINFIVSQANARALGMNMPDGYDLLPSAQYFAHMATPVVNMASSSLMQSSSGIAATSIDNSADLETFLTEESKRAQPAYSDVETPAVLSSTLFDQASALHQNLDSWSPPAGVQVIQIAGWGEKTPSTVRYWDTGVPVCIGITCSTIPILHHTVDGVIDGDGTVVVPSQVTSSNWPSYYINLRDYNAAHQTNLEHGTIMSSTAFLQLFSNILASTTIQSIPFVTTSEPTPQPTDTTLTLRTLSPVTLDAYDSEGRHTGVAQNPDPNSDLGFVEAQIPNSSYNEFGEGKYINVPGDGNYKVVLHGTGTGTFTFEITQYAGDTEQQTISYKDIPVTASSSATIDLSGSNPASTTIALDINGDGKTDITLASSTQALDPVEYAKIMIASIKDMDIGNALKLRLIAQLSAAELTLSLSDKWDDFSQHVSEKSLFGSSIFGNVFGKVNKQQTKLLQQKLDTIESDVEKQLKNQGQNGERGGFNWGRLKENANQISSDQATAIIDMIEELQNLIK